MNRAIREVDDLFGMTQCPSRVGSFRGMARVRSGRSIALRDGKPQHAEIDLTGKSAIALATKFSVPTA